MSGLSLETYKPNLKSVALTILELLALTPKKLGDHVTPTTIPFRKVSKGSCPDCPWSGNMHVKFELRSFNRFGAISI